MLKKIIFIFEILSIIVTLIAGIFWIKYPNTLEPYIFVITVIFSSILEILRRILSNTNRQKDKIKKAYDRKFNALSSIEEILDEALTQLELISKTDYNQIILDFTNKHSNHLHVVADAIPRNKQRYDIVIYDGLIGKSFKSGDTIIVKDTSKNEDYFSAVPETQSEICIPIQYNHHIYGVINSESERANYYTQNLRNELESISSALAKNLNRLGWKLKPEYSNLIRLQRQPLLNKKTE